MVAAALILLTALLAGPSSALGPYPDLGSCPVFPDPPAGLSPKAPSLPDQSAWNQDISKTPVAGNSAATIAYINRDGKELHPDFGSPIAYGFPLSIVSAGQPRLPIVYTAYGAESDQGPFPIPADAPVEGGSGSDDDRHVIAVDRDACVLYEIYRGFPARRPLAGGVRGRMGPALAGPPSQLLHLRRRRRTADLPRPGSLRRGRLRPARARDQGHLREHPPRLDQSRGALRRRHRLRRRPGHGRPPAAQGGLQAEGLQRRLQGDRRSRSSTTG